jgi:heme O synthase-like polyprenyltransferase
VLGAIFLGFTASGFAKSTDKEDRAWAWSVFKMSLLYLTALFVAISVSAH